MAYGQSSGTTTYDPFVSDLTIDAFERCGIENLEIKHLVSARRSSNLLLVSDWSNRGINLWKMDTVPTIIDLVQGTQTYLMPTDTVAMFDTYLQISPNGGPNQDPDVIQLLVGTPIPQTSTLTTTLGSDIVRVTWPNFNLPTFTAVSLLVPVIVGGLTLGGVYTIGTILDANNFTINVTFNATSSQSIQINSTLGTNVLMTPISRNDFAAISYKASQGQPTTYWYQKEIQPQVNVWPVPDGGGPYQLCTYLMRQIQDVNPSGGQTLNLVQRMYYAFVADLARDLSIKWAPDRYALLAQEAGSAWDRAQATDTESVSFFVLPNLSGYG